MRNQGSGWQLLRSVVAVNDPALGVNTIDSINAGAKVRRGKGGGKVRHF